MEKLSHKESSIVKGGVDKRKERYRRQLQDSILGRNHSYLRSIIRFTPYDHGADAEKMWN